MMKSKFYIGQVMPKAGTRGITTGDRLTPSVWHALRVKPGDERAACAKLAKAGVFAFYPQEDRVYVVRGEKITKSYPTITQIIYAKFRHAPQWDVMRDRGIITGVFCNGTTPIVLPSDVIRIVQGLPTTAERVAAAKAALMAINAGDTAQIKDGPLAGLCVDVVRVCDGRVWWQTAFGLKGQATAGGMVKVLRQGLA